MCASTASRSTRASLSRSGRSERDHPNAGLKLFERRRPSVRYRRLLGSIWCVRNVHRLPQSPAGVIASLWYCPAAATRRSVLQSDSRSSLSSSWATTFREIEYPPLRAVGASFPWGEFSAATAERMRTVLEERAWTDTVVVAKSMGTGVLADAGSTLAANRPRAIWLTPLFGNEPVERGAIGLGWPSLLVAGSADPLHDPAAFERVATALTANTLLVDGADHSLEVGGDAHASVAVMAQLVDAVAAFAS